MSEYEQGYKDGSRDTAAYKNGLYRIAAFGAIRRAIETARKYDAAENKMRELDYTEAGGVYGRYADNIRRTIRAAIGSDKA